MQKLIYCKAIPQTKTRKAFLEKFFELKPATQDADGNEECGPGRKRSLTDLHMLTMSRFPNTSFEAIVRIVDELSQKGLLMITFCNTIKKVVVLPAQSPAKPINPPAFISSWGLKNFMDSPGVDGYDLRLIDDMRAQITKMKSHGEE